MRFERLFVLWPPLIRSLYFIQVYIFIPLINSAPFLRFSHTLLYTNFFICIYPRGIYFFNPWWCCWSATARNVIYIVNFSSPRPYLNYILLSNVWSFDIMEFFMKHKCQLAPICQQSLKPRCFCLLKSLGCVKVVVSKLHAIHFSSAESMLNL